jgi:acyl carrier protein
MSNEIKSIIINNLIDNSSMSKEGVINSDDDYFLIGLNSLSIALIMVELEQAF